MVSPVIAVVVLTGVLVLALVAWRAAVSGRVWPVLWLLPPVGVAIVGELVAAGMATGAGPEGLVPALEAAAAAWAPALQARWGAAVLATLAAVGAAALAGRVEAQDPRWSPVGWGVLGVAGLAGLWVAIGAGLWIGASGAAAGVVLGVAGAAAGWSASRRDAHDEVSDTVGPRTRLVLVAGLGLGLAAASSAVAVSRQARVWALGQATTLDMDLGWWVADRVFQAEVVGWTVAVGGLAMAAAGLLPAIGSLASPRAPLLAGLPLVALLAVGGTRWAAEARVGGLEAIGANEPVLDLVSHEIRTVSMRRLKDPDGTHLVHLDIVPVGDVIAWDGQGWVWRLRRREHGWEAAEGPVEPADIGALGHPMVLVGGRTPAVVLLDLRARLPPGTPELAVPFREPHTEFLLHPYFAHLQVTWLIVRETDGPPWLDAVSGHRLTATGRREVRGSRRADRVRQAIEQAPPGPVPIRVGDADVQSLWQACSAVAVPLGRTRPVEPDRRCTLVR